MQIRWEDFEPRRYEDMISVLISRLHPDSQRIDGKGGDGGRDVQILSPTGEQIIHAFELKSFTGRIKNSRRTQVKNSLKRAKQLKPLKWSLVVPIDPTTGELDWFNELSTICDFPIKWLGKTWLDQNMAAHEDIRRYFVENAEAEVVRLIRELKYEKEIITNTTDAAQQLHRIHRRLGEIDPHYRYEISTVTSATEYHPVGAIATFIRQNARFDVFEKYRNAHRDRPITARVNFILKPNEIELRKSIQTTLDYGRSVRIPASAVESFELDAPGGLGGSFDDSELIIQSAEVILEEPLHSKLNIMDGDTLVASWPLNFTQRTVGYRGMIFDGCDETGWLQAQLKLDSLLGKFDLRLQMSPKPVMPSSVAPLMRWLRALHPPRRLVINWPLGQKLSCKVPVTPLDTAICDVVDALSFLQQKVDVYFPFPHRLSKEDEEHILECAVLVQGGVTEFTWSSFSLTMSPMDQQLRFLLDGSPISISGVSDESVVLTEGTIPVGPVRFQMKSARVADPSGVRRALDAGCVADVHVVPADSNKGQKYLIPEDL